MNWVTGGMNTSNDLLYPTDQEKKDLMEEVAAMEKLNASIRERLKRFRSNKKSSIVTSITARLRRLELPDPDE